MEEEIDLRPYIEALLKRWYVIVGAGVVTAVVALIMVSILPPSYEATSLVAITEARQIVQFDPRFNTVVEEQPLQAYPELALSDELLLTLLGTMDPPLANVETVQGLRGILEAVSGSDPSLIRLTAMHSNPQEAARVANTWAALFVEWANNIYGDEDGEQLVFFESQLIQAANDLDEAEQLVIIFNARDRTAVLQNQLDALNRAHADYLRERRDLTFLVQDLNGLRMLLQERSGSAPANFADQLTLTLMQMEAFDVSLSGGSSVALQMDGSGAFDDLTTGEQIELIEDLITTVETQLEEIDSYLAELEPQILAIQADKQEAETEKERLQREQELTQETYIALSRKVEEERITSQDTNRGVRLASRADVPENPTGPRRLLVVLGAAVLGGGVGIMLVLLYEWWRPAREPDPER